ncbi:barstar family protein [Actinoallomurus sp. CA-142502]|uniref:barstar family protein n=1 Tax=Actinoallomurus sp. CA-142502 TaxID=3239885 RepID=UPI003D93B6F3
MTTDRPGRAGDPWQRRWTWDRRVSPRWLLVGHTGTPQYPDEDALALCADIDGLFIDLPPRPRERFTLLGCTPDGALASILDSVTTGTAGSERAWLGDLRVSARRDDPATGGGWMGEELLDVTVLAHRPSQTSPGCVDVELEGLVGGYDRTDGVDRPGDVTGFVLSGPDDTRCGVCVDVTGVFRERAEPLVPHVVLVGCRPEPSLLAAIAAVPQSTKAGLRRRRVSAQVGAVAADGSVVWLVNGMVSGTIVSSVPSALGDGLLDVTIASDACEPCPAGTRGILDLWFTGRPIEPNLWARYDRTLRHEWAGVALAHHRSDVPDQPAGTVFDLDGRFVTDIEGFYCAIGEAINGPGGYFGWNLGALDDCLGGKWGARAPFRLVWHDSAVAGEHLVAGYDRHRYAPAVTLDYLLQMFAEHDVEVELR